MAKKQDVVIGIIIIGSIVVFFGFMFLFIIVSLSGDEQMPIATGERVGIIELNGVIASSRGIVRQFKEFSDNDDIKSIVFRIDSPGGGIAASQEIYEQVRRVRDSGKPVVVSMGSVAASGGYYVALGSSAIMANPGTTTGSIGVIAEIPNFSRLLDKVGISYTVIKSGRFKDIGSPFRDTSKEELEELQKWIDNGYNQFVDTIAEERDLAADYVRSIGDGRIYSGEQALELGLIDTLGTYEDAILYAGELGGIEGEPKTYRIKSKKITLFDVLTGDVQAFINRNLGTWPRVKYQVAF